MPATLAPVGERLGTIEIEPRFNGPAASANGGYACGRVAAFVAGPAEVTLRMPPPLGAELAVVADGDGGVRLLDADGAVIAEGRRGEAPTSEPPLRPSFEDAVASTAIHPGRGVRHPLSDCFVCGPERGTPGDGLGISPGPLDVAADIGAAPFVPDESLADDGVVLPEIVWAALDCPSYAPSMWASESISLLGRLTAVRHRDVLVGERLAAVGWLRGAEGRRALHLLGADRRPGRDDRPGRRGLDRAQRLSRRVRLAARARGTTGAERRIRCTSPRTAHR